MRSLILITLASTWLLAACGQKGPLYLPSPDQPEDTRQSGILNAPPPPDVESESGGSPGNETGTVTDEISAPETFERRAPQQ